MIHYQQIAEQVALQQHNTMTQNARMFGLTDVAMGDAGIAAWDAKYTYNRWRPITAIQLANTDGNPAHQAADPTWQPLGSPGDDGKPNFTPPFPSYVSGHATFGAAMFTTLADFYGTNNVHLAITSDEVPGVTRSYSSFSQASYENAISRIYLGVHFWFDETAGMTVGSAIAKDISGNVMTVKQVLTNRPADSVRQGGFGLEGDSAFIIDLMRRRDAQPALIGSPNHGSPSHRKTCSTRSTRSRGLTRSRPSGRPRTTS